MGDSQAKYNIWTAEESNELLRLMVDAAMRGWRDRNGVLNKRTVEIKILPTLNAKLGCEKSFAQYQSHLKWFKQRYNNYCKLMRHSSGFGWDSMTKKFTASDEVWEDYFKSHPKHEHYQTDTFEDYEDLRLVVGNGTATGKYAIGLGDDIDARTFETEENGGTNLLDDYVFDHNSGEFIQSNRQESSYQPLFSEDLASPLPSQPKSSEVPQATRKRDRSEFEAKSSTSKNIDPDVLNRLSYTIEKASSKIELVGVADDNCWDAIKQVQTWIIVLVTRRLTGSILEQRR
ncbi:uncharacterized protein At2g29880-like [Zingiber officinale]|uniref:uncharacterized protein At2g29880-like n=1 Tax=Zingiber officinale TaxID=94328 RepID=UPI001C4DB2F0|nr:uncharacterized protein At2g29880-like [Zingiber officinale]